MKFFILGQIQAGSGSGAKLSGSTQVPTGLLFQQSGGIIKKFKKKNPT